MTDLGRVLIADDEETFLNSTADLLRREGYQCDCAPDAIVAAEILRSAHYDLLIADIKMKGNSELELIRNIPQLAEGMPVILVTGYPSVKSAVQSIQLPVAAYLVKPVEFDKLLAQVQDAIKNFRLFKAVKGTQKRLQQWGKDLIEIESFLNTMPRYGCSTPIHTFLMLTFQNIAGALSDLKHLSEVLSTGGIAQEVCHLLNCPRLTTLKQTLADTAGVLERTKSSFKSKELGELRKKLEGLIKADP